MGLFILAHEALHLVGVFLSRRHVEYVKPVFKKKFIGVGFRIRFKDGAKLRHYLTIILLPQVLTIALVIAGLWHYAIVMICGSIGDYYMVLKVIRE